MTGAQLTEADRRQMEALGIAEAQVLSQVEIFERSSFHMNLKRPCTVGDGVISILPDQCPKYLQLQGDAARNNRFIKFVPASGAASRMFQALMAFYHQAQPSVSRTDRKEHPPEFSLECRFNRFFDNVEHFAFTEDLKEVLSRDGLRLDSLMRASQFRTVLHYLFTEQGLNYASCPKGLIGFHRYPSHYRTPFEEHLVEAAHYSCSGERACNLHFTVSPEHVQRFEGLLRRVKASYEEQFETHLDVGFSFQKPSTNTISVDLENRLLRDSQGSLLLRPGGHGALLDNLSDLQGDLVYIKNIDNVVPDRLKGDTIHWKKILGGFLVEAQAAVHAHVRQLKRGMDLTSLEHVAAFASERLSIHLPMDFRSWSPEKKHGLLLNKLNRPIRVCGVVPNEGEPGGAPFWTADKSGTLSVQIVESAQVDFASPGQKELWESSTHFNPVDLVCGVRDAEGKPFNLKDYADPEAVFISQKSKDGKDLKSLELPGLWNGAMADWITFMVEVPKTTFNPVKTTCDLLRPSHQPEEYIVDERACYAHR